MKMMVLICFLLPPVFLMFIRDKILGGKINCNFYGRMKDFLREYLLSTCFLNFSVWAIIYKVFKHNGTIESTLMKSTGFAFHYFMLALVIALIEPILENIIRFHLKINLSKMPVHINGNLMLYVYAIILFIMNFIRIFDNSFWGDEGYSIQLAKMTIPNMLKATAADVHPPMHYLLMQLLYHLFGNNGIAYHLAGLLPYTIIVIISCTIIKKYFGRIPAVIVITMSSLMKSAVQYNVEVRMYSLAAMFILITFIAFYKIVKENSLGGWIVFCIASLGAAYTHYYALISVAFLYVMIIPLAISKKAYRKGLIISYIVAIAAYLPWLIILIKSFGRTANDWWLTNIPKIQECIIFLLDYKWVVVFAVCCFLCFCIYELGILNIKFNNNVKISDKVDITFNFTSQIKVTEEMYWIISGLIAICGTIGVGLVLSYTIRPFLVLRYLFPVSSMLYLIIGVCLSKMKLKKVWGMVLIVAILFNNVPAYFQVCKTDFGYNTETAKFLKVVQPSEEVELVSNHYMLGWTLFDYYYPRNEYSYDVDAPYHLNTNYDEIWFFWWVNELNESEIASINQQHYDVEKLYSGVLGDGAYYHVYKLTRIE